MTQNEHLPYMQNTYESNISHPNIFLNIFFIYVKHDMFTYYHKVTFHNLDSSLAH